MYRKLMLTVLVLGLAVASPIAMAEEGTSKWHVFADAQARWDRLENYFDFDSNGSPQDAFSFTPYRVLVGVDGELANNVSVRIAVQNSGYWGNQTPFLSGASVYAPNFQHLDGDFVSQSGSESNTMLYNGSITLHKMFGSKINATVGRQETEFGNGLIIGNEPFYNGNVFDGVNAGWDDDGWALHGFFFKTSETNPAVSAAHDDHTIDGLYYTNKLGDGKWGDLDVYAVGFQDGFEGFGVGAPHFWTFGGLWRQMVNSKADAEKHNWDWSLEVATQSGDVNDEFDLDGDGKTSDELNLGGTIIEGWLGYNLVHGNMVHRFSAGVYSASGDDDATDGNLDGWVNLYPTVHGRLGNSDFFSILNQGSSYVIGFGPSGFGPGVTAWNLGYRANVNDKHYFGVKYWNFQPTEDSIKTGSSSKVSVGDFGNEFDFWYKYAYSENVWFFANASVLSPDDGLTGGNGAPDDSVTRFYAGIKLMVD